MNHNQSVLIGELNDCYRRDAGWKYSADETAAGNSAERTARRILAKVWQAIRSYRDFAPDDIEHNCGTVEVEGVKVDWRINYLDRWSDGPSSNPADTRITRRTITITMEVPD